MTDLNNKNIGILSGGWSEERLISLESGKAVYDNLHQEGYTVFLCNLKKDQSELVDFVQKFSIDIIFNLIHGTGGEDGTIQSWLDNLNINYIGSNSQSSKLSFSKVMTKQKWLNNGLKTPDYSVTELIEFFEKNNKCILKPDKSGSSVGIEIITNKQNLLNFQSSKNVGDYFVEEYMEGSEYTAPIIGDIVYPIIKIETKREFYDYQAKYVDEDTSFTSPTFDPDMLKEIELTCLKAFQVLGCKGWGRVDFFIDKNKDISLIEVNTIPGMTSHSLVPMSAKKKGLNFTELIIEILKT